MALPGSLTAVPPGLPTLTTAPTFSTFSADWSAKACAGEAPPEDESQFDWSWVDWNRLPGYIIPISKGNGKLSSPIWRLGVPMENHESSDRWWLCKECHCKHSIEAHSWNTRKGSSNIMKHIRVVHGRTFNKKGEEVPYTSKSISVLKGLDANNPREQQVLNELARAFDEKTFRRLLIRWIIYDNVSFRQVDGPVFREFIEYLSPRAAECMPSGWSVRSWIIKGYAYHKAAVKRELQRAVSKIHLSFDLWTSGNLLSFNGVTAHFLNKDFEPRATLLAIPEQTGLHAGVNIAEGVIAVIKDFGIKNEQIGYFMLDNATNNDTAMMAIAKEFNFNPIERRLRCSGHIINIIARHLLYGYNPDLFKAEDMVPKDIKAQLQTWRKRGPVGKAHNLIVWVYTSPQRRHRWHESK